MAGKLYPVALAELESWRAANGTTADEARKRFMQFVVLESIAAAPQLQRSLVFKGGNALRFVYGSRRSTIDLDFSAIPNFPDDAAEVRRLLDDALGRAGRRFGVKARCQGLRRNPPGADKTFATFAIKAGYQLPGDRHFADFEVYARGVSTVVDLEISLNDEVCESRLAALHVPAGAQVRVCVLEDIVAEKLRALLQQPIRKRNRKQDVYDVARIVRDHAPELDVPKTREYLIRKSNVRGIVVQQGAFNEVVRRFAAFEYGTLFASTDPDFIPFDEAWAAVLNFVERLGLPA